MRRTMVAAAAALLLLLGCTDPQAATPSSPAASTASRPTGSSTGSSAAPSTANASVPPVRVAFPEALKVAGSGHVYAETDGGVLSIDIAHRTAELIATPKLDAFKNFVAVPGLLVVKQVDDPQGFLVTAHGELRPLPSEFGGAGRLYRGEGETLWVVPEQPTDGRRLVTRLSTSGETPRVLSRRALSAVYDLPDSDEAGHLLTSKANTLYIVTPRSTKRLRGWRPQWQKIGLGPTAVLVRTCPGCGITQRSRTGTKAPATPQGLKAVDRLTSQYNSGDDGLISANGRYLAITMTTKGDDHTRIMLVDLATGRTTQVPGTLPDVNANDQYGWLEGKTPRLLAVSDRHLWIVDPANGSQQALSGFVFDRVAVAS